MYKVKENAIDFGWYTEQLFDLISRQTMYYARNKRNGQGDDLTDEIGISEDEKDFVLTELTPTMNDLFLLFIKITHSIEDSLFVNAEHEDIVDPDAKAVMCGFSILKHTDANGNVLFNPNRLDSISDKCADFIVCSILVKWAKLNGLQDEVANRSNDLITITRNLKDNLFYLKMPMYGKSYVIKTEA